MTYIFDGKGFAVNKQSKLVNEVAILKQKKICPKLVSILVGDDVASHLYVNLKKQAAERVGMEMDIRYLKSDIKKESLITLLADLNNDKSVQGIMIQLPLPEHFSKEDRDEILKKIAREKDVDGLQEDSIFLTPTVKAVLEVFKVASEQAGQLVSNEQNLKIVVVGSKGFEGKKIYTVLQEMGYETEGIDRRTENLKQKTASADILISVTGSPGIIGRDEVKDGSIIIDVGSPKGDVKTEEVVGKAAFLSPVPGGVGPVTISCLLENLVEASSK